MAIAGTAICATALPVGVFAQEIDSGQGTIESVIVTAQRREENLQSVPLAITAFSERDLQEQRIFSLNDLADRTPGLTVGDFKPGQSQAYIRGIGSNEDGAAADQSVIVFVDEVYVGRTSGQATDLFDLERVEVLRGPQGTLFGKNVIGGAINFVTKKPTRDADAQLEASYGNYDAITLRGFVSGPLSENVFGKLSYSSRTRDGYFESAIDELPQFYPTVQKDFLDRLSQLDVDTQNVRGALRWIASDATEVNVSADFSTRDEAGTAHYFLVGPGNGGDFYRTDAPMIGNYDDRTRVGLFDDAGVSQLDTWSATARIDHDISSDLRLTSLSSYRDVNLIASDILGTRGVARVRLASGAAPFTYVGDNPAAEGTQTFSQELRLTSLGESRLEWVAGLYYLREDVFRNETSNLGLVTLNTSGGLNDLAPQTLGGDRQNNVTDSYAAFGQVTYQWTDQLRLTLGGRYTYEKKELDRIGTAGGLIVTQSYAVDTSKSWSEFTPKATIDYQVNDDVFAYLAASKGFKSGGYQGLAPTGLVASTAFDPETAWLYELGLKTEWLDRRLRINAALFYIDYTDLQVVQSLIPESSTTNTPVLFTQNAADAEIQGAELEFTYYPIDGLRLSGTYAYLDTEYSNFFAPSGFRLPPGAASNREGNALRRAPKNAYTLSVAYDHKLANGGAWQLQSNFRSIDKNYSDPDNLEYGAIPQYSLLSARASYALPGGEWKVSLWVDNALDEDYFLNNFPNTGSGWAVPGPPRMYGVTVNWSLN